MNFTVEILASNTGVKDGVIEVSTAFIEEYFAVSRKTISEWEQKGCPKRGRGKWDLIEVLKWRGGLSDGENDEESKDNIYLEKLKAETFLKQQQGMLAEIDLQKRRGEIVEIEDVKTILGNIIINTKTQFLSLPPRIAPKLLGVSALSELVQILEDYNDQIIECQTPEQAKELIKEIVEEFSEAKTLTEINEVVAQIIYSILEELAETDVTRIGDNDL